jgi:CRP/FNR family transcriptional regulator, cyclic AMP receptor protein
MDPLIGAGSVSAWVVPGVVFLLVIVASAAGLLWIRSEHLETLRAVPLFSGLSQGDLMHVLRSTSGVGYERGSELVKEGDTGKGFFIMTKGTAAVSVGGTQVDTLGPGSYFGEMAVLDGGPRTATITATGQVFVLHLPPTTLSRILDTQPTIAHEIDDELTRRLSTAGEQVAPSDRVDRARLADLSARLRSIRNPDWATAPSSKSRWLGLSKLFARGG